MLQSGLGCTIISNQFPIIFRESEQIEEHFSMFIPGRIFFVNSDHFLLLGNAFLMFITGSMFD